uniref:Uncharacterized protein n=1 Tax=Romanomermis culicivorax TaxID=13658 RepID=A0A915HIV8_ROMCU
MTAIGRRTAMYNDGNQIVQTIGDPGTWSLGYPGKPWYFGYQGKPVFSCNGEFSRVKLTPPPANRQTSNGCCWGVTALFLTEAVDEDDEGFAGIGDFRFSSNKISPMTADEFFWRYSTDSFFLRGDIVEEIGQTNFFAKRTAKIKRLDNGITITCIAELQRKIGFFGVQPKTWISEESHVN